MSIALALVIEHSRAGTDGPNNCSLGGYNRLQFETGDMRGLVATLGPFVQPLPQGVEWYDDMKGTVDAYVDGWDEPMTYIRAGQLGPVLRDFSRNPWGDAVAAFVCALPPQVRIALYWY